MIPGCDRPYLFHRIRQHFRVPRTFQPLWVDIMHAVEPFTPLPRPSADQPWLDWALCKSGDLISLSVNQVYDKLVSEKDWVSTKANKVWGLHKSKSWWQKTLMHGW